ncbi:hypothetical protein [Janibacter melonis]|uniref:hypothetical protein n=1 Tax=Janibacter melonis TaxID=262209 RepID=UPI002094A8DE|nr:hypothetical protein [Janibacter melonis]
MPLLSSQSDHWVKSVSLMTPPRAGMPVLFQYRRLAVVSLRSRASTIWVKRAMTSARGVVRAHSIALATPVVSSRVAWGAAR